MLPPPPPLPSPLSLLLLLLLPLLPAPVSTAAMRALYVSAMYLSEGFEV